MAHCGVAIMTAMFGRFFHWPTSNRITSEANTVRGEAYRQLNERRSSQAPSANGGSVIERDETSPYWGIALILAMAVGASFWVGLIWAVMRMIR